MLKALGFFLSVGNGVESNQASKFREPVVPLRTSARCIKCGQCIYIVLLHVSVGCFNYVYLPFISLSEMSSVIHNSNARLSNR